MEGSLRSPLVYGRWYGEPAPVIRTLQGGVPTASVESDISSGRLPSTAPVRNTVQRRVTRGHAKCWLGNVSEIEVVEVSEGVPD
jgi:hypothetical protein